MPLKKFHLFFVIGGIFIFSGVAFATQYRFKPPVNLGPPVNTTWNERDPYITADGQKLYFCSDRPGGSGSMDVWMSTWNGTSWDTPVNCGPYVNSDLIEWSPSVSPDGTKLYFLAFGRFGGQGGWDVWYSDWDLDFQQWGPAQNMGPVINTPATEWSPEISRDGQSLYYATNGYFHPQGQALYVSHWNGSSWGVPDSFPYIINNTGTEERPSLTADQRTMYFVRFNNFPQIFGTEKNFMGVWSEPVVLDSNINSPGSTDPVVNPDGEKLYFSSSRPGSLGSGDIWMAERILVQKVPAFFDEILLVLILAIALLAIYLMKNRNP